MASSAGLGILSSNKKYTNIPISILGSFGDQKLQLRGPIWHWGKKKGKGICFKHFVAWNGPIKNNKKEQRILMSSRYILNDDKHTQ